MDKFSQKGSDHLFPDQCLDKGENITVNKVINPDHHPVMREGSIRQLPKKPLFFIRSSRIITF